MFYHALVIKSTRQKHWTYLWVTWRVSCQNPPPKKKDCWSLMSTWVHSRFIFGCGSFCFFLSFLSPFCVSCKMLVFGFIVHSGLPLRFSLIYVSTWVTKLVIKTVLQGNTWHFSWAHYPISESTSLYLILHIL